ncbi:MAG: lysozyme [Bdellovibrionales bacterium]
MPLERTRIELNEQAQKLAFQWFLRKGRVPKILIEIIEGTKYNSNWESQPRVPAGSSDGGQWTGGGGSSGGSATPDNSEQTSEQNVRERKPARTFSTSKNGRNLIVGYEKLSSVVYRDQGGYLTIGYGHKLKPGESFPNGISKEEAEKILKRDMTEAERAVQRYVKVPLSQQQFDALVVLTYNIGGYAFQTSTLLRLLNGGKYAQAADQFLKWNKVPVPGTNRHVSSDGLTRRRREERSLFLSGS